MAEIDVKKILKEHAANPMASVVPKQCSNCGKSETRIIDVQPGMFADLIEWECVICGFTFETR